MANKALLLLLLLLLTLVLLPPQKMLWLMPELPPAVAQPPWLRSSLRLQKGVHGQPAAAHLLLPGLPLHQQQQQHAVPQAAAAPPLAAAAAAACHTVWQLPEHPPPPGAQLQLQLPVRAHSPLLEHPEQWLQQPVDLCQQWLQQHWSLQLPCLCCSCHQTLLPPSQKMRQRACVTMASSRLQERQRCLMEELR